tara:strand:+ start:255 stop:566 length:312 start_codon:yes stop_codon:yes gene_type:complete
VIDVERSITENLKVLSPSYLEVVNESFMHAVPPDSETHFKVVIVSATFDGLRLVKRHQVIYRLLSEQLSGPVHALALHTYTADEWAQKMQKSPASPQCKGGEH